MAAYTTIDNPELFFQVVLYTGNGSANNAITLPGSEDMQPDLVWIKNRDATDRHCAFDAVRGATKLLHPDFTAIETTDADTLDSFTSDGFQVDADVKVNTNAEKYVAWCWKANGTGSANTDGSIDTIATSANTTSGFSISTYTGNATAGMTFGHGLGIAPRFVTSKSTVTGYIWQCYNIGLGVGRAFFLDRDTSPGTSTDYWHDTDPSTTVIYNGPDTNINADGGTYVSYAWAPVQGYSKMGSYEGNGNAGGTFVYTGFRPAWVMTKSNDSTSPWHIFDNKREGYNVDNDPLLADTTAVEATTDMIDLLSNGFKFRITTDPNVAETYSYLAFAEAPFVNSEGVPCNAR